MRELPSCPRQYLLIVSAWIAPLQFPKLIEWYRTAQPRHSRCSDHLVRGHTEPVAYRAHAPADHVTYPGLTEELGAAR